MNTRDAVIFDFGGVLTTSVLAAIEKFGASIGSDPRLPLRLLAKDAPSSALLVAHEEGRIGEREFEEGFAARLREHGAEVESEGLMLRMQSGMRPDDNMIELVGSVRAAGHRTGLLSNSLGDDCYAGFDLDSMFDAVVISRDIGVRKPSRKSYVIACDRLGVRPGDAVFVDDLEQNVTAARKLGFEGVVHRDAATTANQLWGLLATSRS